MTEAVTLPRALVERIQQYCRLYESSSDGPTDWVAENIGADLDALQAILAQPQEPEYDAETADGRKVIIHTTSGPDSYRPIVGSVKALVGWEPHSWMASGEAPSRPDLRLKNVPVMTPREERSEAQPQGHEERPQQVGYLHSLWDDATVITGQLELSSGCPWEVLPSNYRWTAEPVYTAPGDIAERVRVLEGLLGRARKNVAHSASHDAGAKSRELLAEIDAALVKDNPQPGGREHE